MSPPWEVFWGMTKRAEALGQTQNKLGRLCLTSALGTPRYFPGETWWLTLSLSCCLQDLNSDERKLMGWWMDDGWMIQTICGDCSKCKSNQIITDESEWSNYSNRIFFTIIHIPVWLCWLYFDPWFWHDGQSVWQQNIRWMNPRHKAVHSSLCWCGSISAILL